MNPATRDQRGGFALLETIVALLILSIALGIASKTISTAVAMIRRSQDLAKGAETLRYLASTKVFSIDKARTITGRYGSDTTWTIGAKSLNDKYPLFAVTVRVRPRGRAGPEFVYRTFASGGTSGADAQ